MFLGGQTVTLGNLISDIGLVSIVVEIGLSDHALKDSSIRIKAAIKPAITTAVQMIRTCLLVVEMYESPWIVEVSRKL